MGDVAAVVADRQGVNLAFLEPSEWAITRRWNGGAELTFKVPIDSDDAGAIAIAERVIKFYRAGVLAFHGRIHEPLKSDQDFVTVTARDPWFDLAWRRVFGINTVNGDFAPIVYTATQAAAIAWGAIASTDTVFGPGFNITGTLRVQQGAPASSVLRDRTYEQGKRIDEIVTELAEASDGFGFVFDPLDGVAGKWATFKTYFPATRQDQPDVKFEYGEGTLANCDGFEEEITFPHNLVTAAGSTAGTVQDGAPFYSRSAWWASMRRYDVFEDFLSRPDIVFFSPGAPWDRLDAVVNGASYGDPLAVYALKPGADAPLLFDEFDVGDVVRLAIRRGRVDVAGSFRVAEATLAGSDDGREQLSSIVLSDPAINRVPRKPEDRLFSLLETAARRLRALEHLA